MRFIVCWHIDEVAREVAGLAAPTPLPRPDVGLGPHLAYAVQWWGFAAVALVVPFVAAGREVRRRSPAAAPPARQGGVGAAGPVPSADGQVAEHER